MTRILVVDDEQDIAETTVDILTFYGFDVSAVFRAADVVAAVGRLQPDVILQDAQMPGLDVAKTIQDARRASAKPILVLLFTASVDAERMWEPFGADGYVSKPFDAAVLTQEIHRRLRGRAMQPSSHTRFPAPA